MRVGALPQDAQVSLGGSGNGRGVMYILYVCARLYSNQSVFKDSRVNFALAGHS